MYHWFEGYYKCVNTKRIHRYFRSTVELGELKEIEFRRVCVDGKGVLPANTGCQIRNRLSLKQVYVERGASMHAT